MGVVKWDSSTIYSDVVDDVVQSPDLDGGEVQQRHPSHISMLNRHPERVLQVKRSDSVFSTDYMYQ